MAFLCSKIFLIAYNKLRGIIIDANLEKVLKNIVFLIK